MISSNEFLKRDKYPSINLGAGKSLSIKTDVNNFRINGAYANKNLEEKLPNNKFFYFRLSGLNIYYSTTKTDINILGSISIGNIEELMTPGQDSSTEYITSCFEIINNEKTKFKICGMKEETVKLWFCQIKSFLNILDPNNCPDTVIDPKTPKIVIKNTEITQPVIIIPTPSKFCNEKFIN